MNFTLQKMSVDPLWRRDNWISRELEIYYRLDTRQYYLCYQDALYNSRGREWTQEFREGSNMTVEKEFRVREYRDSYNSACRDVLEVV